MRVPFAGITPITRPEDQAQGQEKQECAEDQAQEAAKGEKAKVRRVKIGWGIISRNEWRRGGRSFGGCSGGLAHQITLGLPCLVKHCTSSDQQPDQDQETQ
jgi:hypothetical protein